MHILQHCAGLYPYSPLRSLFTLFFDSSLIYPFDLSVFSQFPYISLLDLFPIMRLVEQSSSFFPEGAVEKFIALIEKVFDSRLSFLHLSFDLFLSYIIYITTSDIDLSATCVFIGSVKVEV